MGVFVREGRYDFGDILFNIDCGRCSLSDDDVEEVPCRCMGCPDLCKEKGVCMRGEDMILL